MNKPILLLAGAICLAFFLSPVNAQNIIAEKKTMPSYLKSYVKNASVFTLNKTLSTQLHSAKNTSIELSFEFENKTWVLQLEENDIFSKGFFVKDGYGKIVKYDKNHSRHYKGKIKGDDKSVVALNLYQDEISAIIADKTGNINIGALQNSDDMVIFRETDLVKKPDFTCEAIEIPGAGNPLPNLNQPESITAVVNTEAVDIYYEADYSCYTGKGSNLAATISWVTDLANNVSVLYENDSINVKLSAIKVWTINDPYAAAVNTSEALNTFSLAMSGGFPGDLAHLLSRRSLGGGRAYLNILCNNAQYRTGVSGNLNNGITPLPTYSWNSNVITHELGHNLGSRHTQSCTWVGGPIDNCYAVEDGSCPTGPAPTNGGTIMSYCHLSIGINLSFGFGPLPGALIRNNVRNSNCIYPKISFNRLSETVIEESADVDNNCLDYKLINVKLAASYAPVTGTDIQLLPTALSAGLLIGVEKDVEIILPLSFTLNDTVPQTIQLKVFDDAIIESTENLRLDFNIIANGSNAVKGNLYNLNIVSTDHRPDSTISQTVFFESFDNMGGWTQNIIHGNASPNRWITGNSGDAAFSNSAVYISANNNTAMYAGSSAADSSVVRLISPPINTNGFTNLRLTYLYKCNGEGGVSGGTGQGGTPSDYGIVYYSANNGNTWLAIRENIFGRATKMMETLNLPASANNNPNVRIAFEWRNNSSIVNNPPLVIDSLVLSGTGAGPIQSETHVSNSDTAYLGPNQTVHFYNQVTGKVMASIKNLSAFDFGCTQVDIIRTGTAAGNAWGISNAEKLTDKALKISFTNSSTTPYELSLYATNEEANGWATTTGNAVTTLNIIQSTTDITQSPPPTLPVYSNSNSNILFAANGDRIMKGIFSGTGWFAMGKPGIALVCPGSNQQFTANATGITYQWQVNTGSGFSNISNNSVYSGVNTASLSLTNAPTNWYGYTYRCSITTGSGTTYSYTNELKFAASWKGTISSAWELAANWECNVVPDANTDVFVGAAVPAFPIINNSTAIRTLTILPGATVTVAPSALLNVMK